VVTRVLGTVFSDGPLAGVGRVTLTGFYADALGTAFCLSDLAAGSVRAWRLVRLPRGHGCGAPSVTNHGTRSVPETQLHNNAGTDRVLAGGPHGGVRQEIYERSSSYV
jgi:hypothetical protein